MKPRTAASLFGAIALAAGCGNWQAPGQVQPTSYSASHEQVPRTIGRLRRLALVPMLESAPQKCTGVISTLTFDDQDPLLLEAHTLLVDEKGYDLVTLSDTSNAEWLNGTDRPQLIEDLKSWGTLREVPLPADSAGRALVERARMILAVDGVLLIHLRYTCLLAEHRASYGAMTMGLGLLWPDPESRALYLVGEATLIEAATARPVLHSAQNALQQAAGALSSVSGGIMAQLLAPFEPAVPKVLTE